MAQFPIHPGEHLAAELKALDMSAAELARQLGVPTNRITGILNGRRAVTGDTALRLAGIAGARPPIVVCNEAHRFTVAEQLRALDMVPSAILLEPMGRNTAPAVALAALKALELEAEATIVVAPKWSARHQISGSSTGASEKRCARPSFETLASQAPQDEVRVCCEPRRIKRKPHPEEPCVARRLEGRRHARNHQRATRRR